jgi:uncharacterized C2H2 Zn-finger protein
VIVGHGAPYDARLPRSESALLKGEGEGEGAVGGQQPSLDDEVHERSERMLRCGRCGHGVTRDRDRREVAGAHAHVFMNPHGYVFHVGCFDEAEGAVRHGAATDDFSWFDGYLWRYAHCGACQLHIGWRFEAGGDTFWGLILDRLIEEGDDDDA